MVSHSSASLSSSYFSHTPSSSPSSPPSSPDSAPSSSHDSFGASSASSTLALVPFLWEEKPGVLKKEMQIGEGDHVRNFGEGSHASLPYDVHACAHTQDSNAHSSKRLSRTFTSPRSKMRSESVPRLRPPPRLTQPNVHAYVAADDAEILHHRHHHCGTSAGVRSKVMSSFPFHKRRHHRTPSLEDDPFWMAMVACTNDTGKGRRMRCKGDRDAASKEMQRSDSWLVKRVQGHAIHFEQCMPRQSFAGCTTSSRAKSLASSHCSSLKFEASSPKGGFKSASASNRDITHSHDHDDCTDTGARSAHLAKAFKALNIAKTEIHGRCKALLQQQGSPVDISCSTRRSKKPSMAAKRKLPDIFGCKSDRPLIIPP